MALACVATADWALVETTLLQLSFFALQPRELWFNYVHIMYGNQYSCDTAQILYDLEDCAPFKNKMEITSIFTWSAQHPTLLKHQHFNSGDNRIHYFFYMMHYQSPPLTSD